MFFIFFLTRAKSHKTLKSVQRQNPLELKALFYLHYTLTQKSFKARETQNLYLPWKSKNQKIGERSPT